MTEIVDEQLLKSLFSKNPVDVLVEKRRDQTWNNMDLDASSLFPFRIDGKLKKIVRNGIPHDRRQAVLSKLFGIERIPEYDKDFEKSKSIASTGRLSSVYLSSSKARFSALGGIVPFDRLALTHHGQDVTKYVVLILVYEFPHLTYCPILPSTIALLLHYLSPSDALASVRLMLKRSMNSKESSTWTYFPTNQSDVLIFYDAFEDVLRKCIPSVYRHVERLKNRNELQAFWIKYLNSFLVDILPFSCVLRLFDSFLVEGYKVLFRYLLAVFSIKRESILVCKTSIDIEAVLVKSHEQYDIDVLAKLAFNFQFSRRGIAKMLLLKRGNTSTLTFFTVSADINGEEVSFMPKLHSKSQIIHDDAHWSHLWKWIPKRFRSLGVELIFSTLNNGHALSSLYKMCADHEPLIIFIQTIEDKVFGAYLSESWDHQKYSKKMGKFIGNVETFLFTFVNEAHNMYDWVGLKLKPDEQDKMQDIYENSYYFIHPDKTHLNIGGGGLYYGLSIDDSISTGTTSRCLTFNNPNLDGTNVPMSTFTIKYLEVWAFK